MANKELNIKLIVQGCLAGRELSERRLFELYYGHVRTICRRYAHDTYEAEEMLNDTFFKVFRYLASYNQDLPFKPWLNKVCINACLEHNRKYFQKINIISHPADEIHIPDKSMHSIEDWEDSELILLIQSVSPAYRTVFNLYIMEGFGHQEIANMLNISVGTSKSNLNRAKKQIIKLLQTFKGGKLLAKYKHNG